MAFKFEYKSEEDEKKFGTSTWVIDREREVFLAHEYFGREDNLIKFRLCSYLDGKLLIKVDARDRCAEYAQSLNVKTAKWYDLYNTFIPEEMMLKKAELIALLVEAIDEYGRTRVNERKSDISVKITPFRDK